jgi:DNA-binding CsgD family transcriptional regulator
MEAGHLDEAFQHAERATVARPGRASCEGARAVVGALLNVRAWPTLLVDAAARVMAANDAAMALVDGHADWIAGSVEGFRHRDAATTTELHARIRALAESRSPAMPRTAYFVEQSNGQQTLVTMARVQLAGSDDAEDTLCLGRSIAVLVTLHQGGRRQLEQSCQLLADSFALTPAEARLAFALLDGSSLHTYAEQTGVRISTVRWHLRNALAKTNCGNQRDLVRLLTALIDS